MPRYSAPWRISMTSRASQAPRFCVASDVRGERVSTARRWLARVPFPCTPEEPVGEIFLRTEPAINSPKSPNFLAAKPAGTLVIGRFSTEFNPFLRSLPVGWQQLAAIFTMIGKKTLLGGVLLPHPLLIGLWRR